MIRVQIKIGTLFLLIFISLFFISTTSAEILESNSIYWGSDIFLANDNEWHYNSEFNPNLINMGTYWTTQEPTGLQGRFYDDGRIYLGQDIDHYLGMQPLGIFYVNYFNLTQRTRFVNLTGSTLAVSDNIATYTKGTVSIEFINSFKQIKGNIYMPNSAPTCLIPNCALAVVWEIVDSKGINTDDGNKSTWWFDNAKAAFPIGDIYNNGSKELTKKIFRQDGKIYLVEGVGYNWISDVNRTDDLFIIDPILEWNTTNSWSGLTWTGAQNPNDNMLELELSVDGYLSRWDRGSKDWNQSTGNDGVQYGNASWDLTGLHLDGDGDYSSIYSSGEMVDQNTISIFITANITTPGILYIQNDDNEGFVTHAFSIKSDYYLGYDNYLPSGGNIISSIQIDNSSENVFGLVRDLNDVVFYINGTAYGGGVGESRQSAGIVDRTLTGARYYTGATHAEITGTLNDLIVYRDAISSFDVFNISNDYHRNSENLTWDDIQNAGSGEVWRYLNTTGTHVSLNVTAQLEINGSLDGVNFNGWETVNSSFNIGDYVSIDSDYQYRYAVFRITMNTSYQPETDIISGITISSADISLPTITSYTPETPIRSHEGDNQTFSIIVDQIVNVTWYIDSVEMFNETNVTTSSYSNNTTLKDTYNVTAYVENLNGSRQQVWDWTVTTDWSDWIGTLLQHGDVKLRIPPNNTNGLVSYWSFEAQTYNTAYDVWTNNSNDGTFTDGVTGNWTASGKYGGAWIGDGVNDYIDAGNDISLNITDAITMEAWINLTELPSESGETKVLLGKSDGSFGYRILLDVGTDTLRCQLLGLTDTYPSGTGIPLTAGNYTHIAITYDGSYIKTYVNGILDISDDSSGNISIYSGIFRIGSAAGTASVFNGSIDEVYIYNRALTNDEINESMNNYHTFVSYRNNSVVQDFTIGLVGKYLNVSGTHAANVTISATAKFSSNNVTWTGDTSINSSFSLNDNVTVSLANEYRYWKDINITLTTTYQPETDIISGITITSAEPSIPTITSYTPETPIRSHEGDNQTFSIIVDQIVNVTWYINSVEMFNETNVTTSSYSNNTTLEGTYNVTAYVENLNGSRQQVWDWTVKVPDRIPLSIFMGIGGLIVILLGYTLYGVGIPAIFTALLGAMMAFINSQIAINGSLVQNIGGIDNSGNIVQGYTILEIPMLSYLFLFVGLIMVGLTIYHISKELKYIKDSKLIQVEF